MPSMSGMSSRRAMRSTTTRTHQCGEPEDQRQVGDVRAEDVANGQRPGCARQSRLHRGETVLGAEVPMLTTVRPTISGGMLGLESVRGTPRPVPSSSPPPTKKGQAPNEQRMTAGSEAKRANSQSICVVFTARLTAASAGRGRGGCALRFLPLRLGFLVGRARQLRACPELERGVCPLGTLHRVLEALGGGANGIAEGGSAFAQVVRSAQDLPLDVLLGVSHLPHELPHGLRHGRQALRPEEEQINEEDEDDFRRAHGASKVAASKGTLSTWGMDQKIEAKSPAE